MLKTASLQKHAHKIKWIDSPWCTLIDNLLIHLSIISYICTRRTHSHETICAKVSYVQICWNFGKNCIFKKSAIRLWERSVCLPRKLITWKAQTSLLFKSHFSVDAKSILYAVYKCFETVFWNHGFNNMVIFMFWVKFIKRDFFVCRRPPKVAVIQCFFCW
mgnify:CR=1 FL=1